MAQRPFPLPVQSDKRVSQVSQISDFSVNSNGSDARRHKAHIGPWKLGRTLGRGSSGRVRLAKHAVTGKLAAVKIVPKLSASTIRKDKKGRPQEKEGGLPYGIEREVVIMKLIEHPNIMRLYDVWENKGELYLVLEYIEGGELFDYLVQRKRLPEDEAVDYITQILNAVDYCHRFNICHRDLKPENLLLDRNKKIKVADFGMAALEPSGQMLQTSCGSPHYASPEIVAGKNYHGGPSDIWSCGIILFALLTGHLPFDDENIRTLLLKVKTGYFAMPVDLSMEAKDLLWRMLEIDPLKRIKMEDILSHPLLLRYKRSRGPKLPRAPTYQELGRPVNNVQEIDREILRNLQTLWRGAPKELIIQKLLAPEQNSEKTFYLLLLKYRHDRLENYEGNDEAKPRLPKSASKRSLRSVQSKKSSSSRRGHHKSASRGSKMSATSSHRRGVSFGNSKKKGKEIPPAIPSEMAPPMEREIPNYTMPRRDSPPKRYPPVSPIKQPLEDETTRKMSAEFSQFLDFAFNTSTSPTSVLEDPETYQAKPLAKLSQDNMFLIPRPNSTEPSASTKVDQRQRAHKSAEVAIPLPRIFEEEKDRYADAEEEIQRAAALANENASQQKKRPKTVKGYSYPAKPRAVLGEINANNGHVQVSASSAAAAAMRNFPNKRSPQDQARISSLVETEPPKTQNAARRFFSAPTQYQRTPSEVARSNVLGVPVESEQIHVKRNWFGRKMSVLRAERQAPTAPPSATTNVFGTTQLQQDSPPGHPVSKNTGLAARREAPPPPRIKILTNDTQPEHTSPPFPHPSSFSPEPLQVKQSFFARILGVKPASRNIHTTYNTAKLQREIVGCLNRWERNDLGVKAIEDDRRMRIIRARLAHRNALGLKAVRFRIEIRDYENGSQAVFHLEKGANSSFQRVCQEYEQILQGANVLVQVRATSRMSAYAL